MTCRRAPRPAALADVPRKVPKSRATGANPVREAAYSSADGVDLGRLSHRHRAGNRAHPRDETYHTGGLLSRSPGSRAFPTLDQAVQALLPQSPRLSRNAFCRSGLARGGLPCLPSPEAGPDAISDRASRHNRRRSLVLGMRADITVFGTAFLTSHRRIEPDRETATASARGLVGRPARDPGGQWAQPCFAFLLPRWIHETNPSPGLCSSDLPTLK